MATYKQFASCFLPHGHEHKTLKNIHKGELTEPFSCVRFGLSPNNETHVKMLRQEVESEFKRWQQVHKKNVEYVAIEKVEINPDAFVLQTFLTPVGETALNALNDGLVWNNKTMSPDIETTYSFYEDKIENLSFLNEDVWGPVTLLAREYAELRPLRAQIVYLRMAGDMRQGHILKPPVSAS